MSLYVPDLVVTASGVEQRFDANAVSIEEVAEIEGGLSIALGELSGGIPVHSLVIETDEEFEPELFVIWNDQGNQRVGEDVERIDIDSNHLRIVFFEGRGPWSGRVSLAPGIELFDGDASGPVPLRSVRVALTAVPPADVARLRSSLKTRAALARKTSVD